MSNRSKEGKIQRGQTETKIIVIKLRGFLKKEEAQQEFFLNKTEQHSAQKNRRLTIKG